MSLAIDQTVVASRVDLPKEKLAAFCERWGVAEVALFGSVLRDDFKPDSDIDVLVRFRQEATPSLFTLVRMEAELAALMGRRVDLVEWEAVEQSPNYIRREAILASTKVIHVA